MDIMMMVLVGVFICVGVALVVVLIELTKILKTTNTTITDVKTKLDPVLDDVAVMTNDLKPAVKKADPLVDRLQLTLDAVNLEMMRVDEILEDVEMTGAGQEVTITDPTVTKTGDSDGGDNCNFYGLNAAVLVKDGSTTTITGGTITSDGNGMNELSIVISSVTVP